MIDMPLEQLHQLVSTLPEEDWELLTDAVLGLKPGQMAAPFQQIQAYVWEWLAHLGFVTDAQRLHLLRGDPVVTDLLRHALSLIQDRAVLPYSVLLAVCDRRWVHYCDPAVVKANDGDFIDLRRLRRCTKPDPDEPFVTTIICDLIALVCRKNRWAQKWRNTDVQPGTVTPQAREPGGASQAAHG